MVSGGTLNWNGGAAIDLQGGSVDIPGTMNVTADGRFSTPARRQDHHQLRHLAKTGAPVIRNSSAISSA